MRRQCACAAGCVDYIDINLDAMVLLTVIGRLRDGLLLSASVQEDEQTGRNLAEFQSQAKILLRRLDDQSPAMSSIESHDMLFQYESDLDNFLLGNFDIPDTIRWTHGQQTDRQIQ
jgi:vesicle transport protein SEC22